MRLKIAAMVVGALISFAYPALAQSSQGQKEAGKLEDLGWVSSGNVKFSASSSTLTLPPDFYSVTGNDAGKANRIINGKNDDLEALVVGKDNSATYFKYFKEGYVSLDDWGDVDPDEIIKGVSENTEKANSQRAAAGISPLHVDGWLTKPTLDRENARAYWAFSAHSDDGEKTINAVVLQLGRHGFEKIVWAGDVDTFKTSASFETIMKAYSFDQGSKYSDHVQTDKAAAYGVAGLVGSVIGVKLVKAGLLAGLAVLLKKFIVVPFLVALALVKKLFSRKKAPPANPSSMS